ncbi:MAG: hypothetical protein GX442_04415 [Candidatus Riflebacteria bacterium]|nr:hypothetical protein [Candidatus Riflebacteria bacterium]
MNCETVRDRLAEFALGDLPTPETKELETHLASCPGCRREAERQRATIGRIRGAFRDFDPARPQPRSSATAPGKPTPSRAGHPHPPSVPAPEATGWLAWLAGLVGLGGLDGQTSTPAWRPALGAMASVLLIALVLPWALSLRHPAGFGGPAFLEAGSLVERLAGRTVSAPTLLASAIPYQALTPAMVSHPGLAKVSFRPQSIFQVTTSGFELTDGFGRFEKTPGANLFRVVTPQAIIGVRGTIFEVMAEAGRTSVRVIEGSVAMDSGSGSLTLAAGEVATVLAAAAPHRVPQGAGRWERFTATPRLDELEEAPAETLPPSTPNASQAGHLGQKDTVATDSQELLMGTGSVTLPPGSLSPGPQSVAAPATPSSSPPGLPASGTGSPDPAGDSGIPEASTTAEPVFTDPEDALDHLD